MNNYEDELYHHGILGQKWGVRRYQNPDGSLTAEGRKRYLKDNGQLTEEGKQYFSKKPSRAQKKAYKESFKAARDRYYETKEAKNNRKRRDELERIQDEEFYKDPDAFDYGDGTKRYKEASKEMQELYFKNVDAMQKHIVDDLLNQYSTQELKWLDKNTITLGMRLSEDILNEASKKRR